MRLLVETELKPAGGLVGAGLDECRWPRPVRPGDELRVKCEVIEVRPSKSHPAQGLIKVRTTTLNQDDEAGAGLCREHGRATANGHTADGSTLGGR
jgi:acyl dehydratase